ncbi:MAG TPA: aminotransferase class I/II-fold pyridoxal phosphate-dependent enzyme [Alphaproteobacteria bacterium]|nr:aminotransferase class I/II-fold pyridoxal phosphate-dependent enzyme [Alphaproteobacteria bacterium]
MNERHAAYRPATRAAQALSWVEPATGGITPAIYPASTYVRDAAPGRPKYLYSRDDNPTYEQAEQLLASLEGGAAALLFSSGMAAASALIQCLAAGDHVVLPEVVYWGVRRVAKDIAGGWGIAFDFVPNGDLDALARTVRPGRTKLVWLETPCNPTMAVADIEASSTIAHRAGALVVVDSTFASPVLTRPIELGADIVMHSGTKYLNGHSDVIAGALVTKEPGPFWERLIAVRRYCGAVLGPFEAWLLLRGMRTLFLRVRSQSQNAMALAAHFEGHQSILQVLYPGLQSHPDHATARRQMAGGFGGMLSLRIRGGEEAALRVWGACKLFKIATSLGGVESLIEHRASIEGADSPVPKDLIRLSVGIEDMEDLVSDLEQALLAA